MASPKNELFALIKAKNPKVEGSAGDYHFTPPKNTTEHEKNATIDVTANAPEKHGKDSVAVFFNRIDISTKVVDSTKTVESDTPLTKESVTEINNQWMEDNKTLPLGTMGSDIDFKSDLEKEVDGKFVTTVTYTFKNHYVFSGTCKVVVTRTLPEKKLADVIENPVLDNYDA